MKLILNPNITITNNNKPKTLKAGSIIRKLIPSPHKYNKNKITCLIVRRFLVYGKHNALCVQSKIVIFIKNTKSLLYHQHTLYSVEHSPMTGIEV